jgi:hypothetical protein
LTILILNAVPYYIYFSRSSDYFSFQLVFLDSHDCLFIDFPQIRDLRLWKNIII